MDFGKSESQFQFLNMPDEIWQSPRGAIEYYGFFELYAIPSPKLMLKPRFALKTDITCLLFV